TDHQKMAGLSFRANKQKKREHRLQKNVSEGTHPGSHPGTGQYHRGNTLQKSPHVQPAANKHSYSNPGVMKTPKRRKRYYYEIYLSGFRTVAGQVMEYGMLDAERKVDEIAADVVRRTRQGYRGALIMRLGWRKSQG